MEKKEHEKRAVTRLIKVEILSLNEGLKKYDATLVRIKDSKFTVLLMTNYNDTLGQIHEGSVQVVTEDNEYSYEKVNGYYLFKKNTFTLMIEEKENV